MSTKTGIFNHLTTGNIRDELFTQVAALFKGIPHRTDCACTPVSEQDTRCSCDIGNKLNGLRSGLSNVISSVTEG